jgi:hypothetical protein
MKIILAICLALSLALSGCGIGNTHTDSGGTGWDVSWSDGVTLIPAGGLWSFDFPAAPGHVNYVTESYTGKPSHQISMTYRIDGTGEFGSAEPTPPDADVTLMIEKRGDDFETADSRWWAFGTVTTLAPGVFTVSATFDPIEWSNVYGINGADDSNFQDALDNLGHVGMTFGGGCCFGHGVFMKTGTAKMTLLSFTIS